MKGWRSQRDFEVKSPTKPMYFCRVWMEDDFYLIRVEYVRYGHEGSEKAIGYMTQTRDVAEVEGMAQELIETLIESGEFEVVIMFTGGAKIE